MFDLFSLRARFSPGLFLFLSCAGLLLAASPAAAGSCSYTCHDGTVAPGTVTCTGTDVSSCTVADGTTACGTERYTAADFSTHAPTCVATPGAASSGMCSYTCANGGYAFGVTCSDVSACTDADGTRVCGTNGYTAGSSHPECASGTGSGTASMAGLGSTSGATASSTPPASGAQFHLPGCAGSGNCSINDIINTGVSFANFLIGLSGAVFFAVFVLAGVQYVFFAYDSKKAGEAKTMMTTACVGMLIIVCSSLIMRFVKQTIVYGGTTPGDLCSAQMGVNFSCQDTTGWTTADKSGCVPSHPPYLCPSSAGYSAATRCCPVGGTGVTTPASGSSAGGSSSGSSGGSSGGGSTGGSGGGGGGSTGSTSAPSSGASGSAATSCSCVCTDHADPATPVTGTADLTAQDACTAHCTAHGGIATGTSCGTSAAAGTTPPPPDGGVVTPRSSGGGTSTSGTCVCYYPTTASDITGARAACVDPYSTPESVPAGFAGGPDPATFICAQAAIPVTSAGVVTGGICDTACPPSGTVTVPGISTPVPVLSQFIPASS